MDLGQMLSGVREHAYDPQRGAGQPAQAHLRAVRTELQQLLPPIGLRVRVSGAAVNLPQFPWIAVLDPDVTKTARSGLYVVYLYDEALEYVHLTMNQGATAHRSYAREHPAQGMSIDEAAIAELYAESKAIRSQLPDSLVGDLPPDIKLNGLGFLPKAYEAGSIAARTYNLEALPPETELRDDLRRFLAIYDSAVDARKRLTAANPDLFHTPAVSQPPSVDPDAHLFRPKEASDYVARVAGHTQIRTRHAERFDVDNPDDAPTMHEVEAKYLTHKANKKPHALLNDLLSQLKKVSAEQLAADGTILRAQFVQARDMADKFIKMIDASGS